MSPPDTSEFHAAALEFHALASCRDPIRDSDLSEIRALLLRLMYHISAVRERAHSVNHSEGAALPVEKLSQACERFRHLPFDAYRIVFNPHDSKDDEPVIAMLSDDLADIYEDLAGGLRNWSKGLTEDACFDWWQGYSNHWYWHAINALSAIEHHLMSKP